MTGPGRHWIWVGTEAAGVDPDQAARISAANLAPSNSLESAIWASLAPGNYTAIVRGKNNGVGIGIVEVYSFP